MSHCNARNIAVDPTTRDWLISGHGARGGDEINRIVAFGNCGWPVVTGGIDEPFARVIPLRRLDGYQDTMLEWTPLIAQARPCDLRRRAV
ncbi:PQQ-dependent sugar dehydrogenase [Frateuria aurantia]|uniref:PQQ-dependent sugar dehydrogenase n=1 Tax=Frateuria aurantia TaxID=81475 RepID=UPI003CE44B97